MVRSIVRAAVAALVLAVAVPTARGGEPRRVVCLGPSLVETAFALGCGGRLVGVDDYAAFPPAVRDLPRVGGVVNPNLERITALGPDLILLASPIPRLEALAHRQGIPVAVVPMEDVAGIRRGVLEVASRLGCPERGKALAARIVRELEAVRRTASRPGPRVVIQVGRPAGPGLAGIVVAGGRTFLGELVTLAGGRNLFDGARRRYPVPSLERLAASPPDLVFALEAGVPDPEAERSELERAWRALLGREAPRIVVLADPVFVVPGPRVAEAARRLAAILAREGAP